MTLPDSGPKAGPSLGGLRVLLVAHDFPPVRSPQAVRAAAFARELSCLGAQVIVLTRAASCAQDAAFGCEIRRASPGWFESTIERLSRRRPPADASLSPGPRAPARSSSLNWKGRVVRRVRQALDIALFPNATRLWLPDARRKLGEILPSRRPHVAILMHEPATALMLSGVIERAGINWVADLGDPVCAAYTLPHWRRSAISLEAQVMHRAGSVTVTNEATKRLLVGRHRVSPSRIEVVTQGYDHRLSVQGERAPGLPLRLVYTGRFYSFRSATALLDAVLSLEGVVLEVAGPELPQALEAAQRMSPQIVRVLGELSHAEALQAQQCADVLISIGNRGLPQTPGKVFEYVGAGRPILHLSDDVGQDETANLVVRLNRGLVAENSADAIVAALSALASAKARGALDSEFDLGAEAVVDCTWQSQVAKLAKLVSKHCVER